MSPDTPSGIRSRLRLAAALPLAAAALLGCNGLGADLPGAGDEPEPGLDGQASLAVVAEGLDTPWEIRFLPGGDLLVTERPGALVRMEPARGEGSSRLVERHEIPGVTESGEGGLMGLALHPEFPSTPWLYLCHTTSEDGGLENRLVRYRYEGGELSERTTFLTEIPGASIHDGCRLEFGPDGLLYVTTGDAGQAERAQDRGSLAGKVLRLTEDGEVPPGNPFGTRVFSYGHRNPQGLAFDDRGRLWATEHGPSGMASGRDELNLVRAGENYGWPEITGDESAEGMVPPVLQSGGDTWAPAGLAYADGRLFFGGLRGRALFEVRGVDEYEAPGDPAADGAEELRLLAHFEGELGRLRPVRVGPDGRIYFASSNRDGRGNPRQGDDRVFAVDPADLLAAGEGG